MALIGPSYEALNITAATVVVARPAQLIAVSIVVAGSAAGAIYDSTSTSGNTSANQTIVLSTTAQTIVLPQGWQHLNGIVVAPGTGQTIAVQYI
jgi:hypothetical protein